jgi:hypothetical protein
MFSGMFHLCSLVVNDWHLGVYCSHNLGNDGGGKRLWNVGHFLPTYTIPQTNEGGSKHVETSVNFYRTTRQKTDLFSLQCLSLLCAETEALRTDLQTLLHCHNYNKDELINPTSLSDTGKLRRMSGFRDSSDSTAIYEVYKPCGVKLHGIVYLGNVGYL